MKTLQKQISLFTEDKSTSSQEDSLASRIVSQGNEKAKKMNATSGQKCLEQFEKFNHVGLWAKTFAALLVGMEGWYSMRCKLTWKLKGTKSNRLYFQLAVSTLPTEGIESGLLLTPTTNETPQDLDKFKKRMEKYPNGTTMPNLATQVIGMLPTPVKSDADAGAIIGKNDTFRITSTGMPRKINQKGTDGSVGLARLGKMGMLPTPREAAARGNCSNDRNKGNLEDAIAKLLPTSTTRDWKGGRSKEALKEANRNETNSLPDSFAQTGKTSQLSPQFVMEMMGFDPDWTLLPFLSGETNQ